MKRIICYLPVLLLSGCMTVQNAIPTAASCEAGEPGACAPRPEHQQAVIDAGAILLGMRFSALRYNLHDDTLP